MTQGPFWFVDRKPTHMMRLDRMPLDEEFRLVRQMHSWRFRAIVGWVTIFLMMLVMCISFPKRPQFRAEPQVELFRDNDSHPTPDPVPTPINWTHA